MKFAPLKRLAVIGLATAGVLNIGCDDLSSGDKSVQEKLKASETAWDKVDALALREDIEIAKATKDAVNAAANEKTADPSWSAVSAGAAGDLGNALAIARRSQLTDKEHQIREKLSELRILTQQVALTNLLAKGYALKDPKAEVVKIEGLIKDMQGDAAKATWSPDSKVQLPTLAANKQQISKLTGDVATRKEQIAKLAQERQAALTLAETKFSEATKSKGNQSVAIFSEGADARRKAEQLAIQTDVEQDQLARIEADLALAQAQEKSTNAGISLLQDQLATINAGWADTQTRIQNQKNLAESILAGSDAIHISISGESTELAKAMVEAKALRAAVNNDLEGAAKHYKDASTAGSKIATDKRISMPPPGNKAYKDLREAVHTNRYKLPLAGIVRIQGTLAADEAMLAAEIERVRSALRAELDASGKSLPSDMPSYEVSEIRTLVTAAEDKLNESKTLLLSVGEGDSPKSVSNASLQSLLVTLHRLIALQELKQALNIADAAGKIAELKSDALSAKANILSAGLRLPPLPGELGQAPPPAAPPPAPPAAPAAPASPDERPAAPAPGGLFGQPVPTSPEPAAPVPSPEPATPAPEPAAPMDPDAG